LEGDAAVKIFIHNSADNVAVALADLKPGETVEFKVDGESRELRVRDEIPYGHKIALRDISKGEKVIKYGEVIGEATEDIPAGSHVHIHNIRSLKYR